MKVFIYTRMTQSPQEFYLIGFLVFQFCLWQGTFIISDQTKFDTSSTSWAVFEQTGIRNRSERIQSPLTDWSWLAQWIPSDTAKVLKQNSQTKRRGDYFHKDFNKRQSLQTDTHTLKYAHGNMAEEKHVTVIQVRFTAQYISIWNSQQTHRKLTNTGI